MRPELIVIVGAPAVGKTTVASLLSKKLHAIHLQEDHFNEAQRWRKFKSPATNKLTIETLEILIEFYFEKGFSVVLDGLFARSSSKDRLLELKKKYKNQMNIFLLTAPVSIHIKRNNDRDKKVAKKHINLLPAKIASFYQSSKHVKILDAENISADELVRQIIVEAKLSSRIS